MNRTRLSLHYLYSYLIVIGLALLCFPKDVLIPFPYQIDLAM